MKIKNLNNNIKKMIQRKYSMTDIEDIESSLDSSLSFRVSLMRSEHTDYARATIDQMLIIMNPDRCFAQ